MRRWPWLWLWLILDLVELQEPVKSTSNFWRLTLNDKIPDVRQSIMGHWLQLTSDEHRECATHTHLSSSFKLAKLLVVFKQAEVCTPEVDAFPEATLGQDNLERIL